MGILYKVHFKGVFFSTQRLLPLINDGGRIINLSSGLTRIIFPGSAAYGSMKGAIEVLTKYGYTLRGDADGSARIRISAWHFRMWSPSSSS
jgi:NAD(P)-dependent dehydrogenase (short-subunit alcohol dehydrogenase family)